MTGRLPRPAADEFNQYYARYIAMVPDGDIVDTLGAELETTIGVLARFDSDGEVAPYAEGKWTPREVIGHLIDVERLFAYRALTIARQEGTDLPGMDQDEWAANSPAGDRPLAELAQEWRAVRASTVHLFRTFDAETGARRGRASGYEVSARALAWMIAGHEIWHRSVLLKEYLGDAS